MARTRKPKTNYRPIVDRFVEVRNLRRATEKEYQELRTQLLALGIIVIEGTDKSVVVLDRSRLVLDTDQLKLDYGVTWFNNYCYPTDYHELEVINNG